MKKLTARDKYLRKKFGITEEEFDIAFEGQGSVCKACRRPPGARALHVDHDHAVERMVIQTKKIANGKWKAWPKDGSGRLCFIREGRTKAEARAKVKEKLKRMSVRGILCWPCNAGLKKYQDDPIRMRRASEYLCEYKDFIDGERDDRNGFKD